MTGAAGRFATPLRFATVGAATAALYALLFAGFSGLGLATAAANLGAYVLAVLFQFAGQRSFTFRAAGPVPRMAARFAATNAAGLAVSTGLALLLRDGIGAGALATGVAVSLALAGSNWFALRLWVFRP